MSSRAGRPGPHIRTKESVESIMWAIVLALIPVTVAAVIFFGLYALYLVVATTVASIVFEIPFAPKRFSLRKPWGDGSAALTGVLTGLTLAPGSPWWIPFLAAFLAVVIAKHLFGGLGNNLFNPALFARGALLLGWPGHVVNWREPFTDAVTTATPLEGLEAGYLELFLGNVPGSIGETSVIAILIGAAFMSARGIRSERISLSFLASAAVTAFLLGADPLFTLLSGSVMFAGFFMATDMVTSPMSRTGRIVFGVGGGVLTVLIREFTIYPAGATFAILIMNAATPLIDWLVQDPKFGEVTRRNLRWGLAATLVGSLVVFAGIGYGTEMAREMGHGLYVTGAVRQDMRAFFPGARYAEPLEAPEGVTVERIFDDDRQRGYLVYGSAGGYGGPIRLVAALDEERRIRDVRVREHNESPTLGSRIAEPGFLEQFIGLTPDEPERAVEELEVITGATVSSRATANAIEAMLGFEEPDVDPKEAPAADVPDGTHRGTGRGYGGDIVVDVEVSGGRINDIEVVTHEDTENVAAPAFDALIREMIDRQTTDVDTVSGATGSSRGLREAVEDALWEAE